ncbi:MAG: hypothetical protein ACLS6O_07830 [Bifidobacterium sp.]
MAKQDKETYDSYEKDVYDNPPADLWVFTVARSAASRPCRTSLSSLWRCLLVCCSGAFIQVRSTI